MKARLIRSAKLHELLGQIFDNLELYRSGDFNFLTVDTSCFIEIEHEIDENVISDIRCDGDNHREVENCIAIYNAVGTLTNYLARDDRIWTYLVHTDLLNYSRQRWPIPEDDENAVKHIKNHFFVIGARGFERDNAASRLWWMASLCDRVNNLSLEEALTCLLYQYDVRANIIERPTTSQSIQVFSAILNKLHQSYQGDKSLFGREKFRLVMRKLNLIGGIKLLGAMDEKHVDQILEKCI